jgi:hypothetical protein
MKLWQPEIPLGIYFAVVNISSQQTIVIGRPNQQIVLISCGLTVGANTSLTWQTSTGFADIFGPSPITATGGYILPFNAGGWFQTLVGDSLVLLPSPSASVGGGISYIWVEQPGN